VGPLEETTGSASNFAPSSLECPKCGALSKRHSIRKRQIKEIDLERPTVLDVRVGVYKCQSCQKFFRFQPPMVQRWKHYSARAIDRARTAVSVDKTTFAGLPRRLDRDFHIRPATSTTYLWFHEAADQIDLARDYEPWAVSGFSGVLALDELYDGFAVLVATDPLNDKTISVRLCKSATEKEMFKFLRHLKRIGVNPAVVVTDGSPLYQRIPQRVWPSTRHQLCIFHYTKLVTERVFDALRDLRRFFKKTDDSRVYAGRLWSNRYLFVTRPEHLTYEQKRILNDLCERHGTVNAVREFMVKSFALFDRGQTREDALAKREELVSNPVYRFSFPLHKAIRTLRPDQFVRAITFLDYKNCPRTTNHVERANRYYRKRAKSHYRNRTKRAIWNMVKSDLMVRKVGRSSGDCVTLRAL
jgi:transposase-like protein